VVKDVFRDFPGGRSGDAGGKAGKNTGCLGEEIAVAYLRHKGYSIVERNYRRRFGEIDIIAKDGETVVFVEVKTRKSARFGSPFDAVDLHKQKKMSRVALAYLSSCRLFDRPARFDVVAVFLRRGSSPEVEIIQDAFELYGE
jgi:putative endonuclease